MYSIGIQNINECLNTTLFIFLSITLHSCYIHRHKSLNESMTLYTICMQPHTDYMSSVKPFWLTGIQCVSTSDSIVDFNISSNYPTGYTTCTCFDVVSIYDSAQINCGAEHAQATCEHVYMCIGHLLQ